MSSSLQDQLLKAGLVTEEQVKKTRATKRKSRKRAPRDRHAKPDDGAASRAAAERRRAEQDRARELNRARESEREEKALRARIRDRVLAESLNDENADVPYNVVHGNRIRRIYVTAAQREGLIAGTLAIATARGRHHVVSADVADEIAALMPAYFVYRQGAARSAADPGGDEPSRHGDRGGEDDDPYAGYEVPDDLIW